jgi:hypothetical protein
MDELIEWLLEGPPWVQYRTRLDLLNEPEDSPRVLAARQEMIAHPQIQTLVSELSAWPRPILKNHKSAGHPLHKLTFIADVGLRIHDPKIQDLTERILENQADEGPFQVLVNISPRYGGTGHDQLAWMLCDAPLLVYALAKFGLTEDTQLHAAIRHLMSLIRDNMERLERMGLRAKAYTIPLAYIAHTANAETIEQLRQRACAVF